MHVFIGSQRVAACVVASAFVGASLLAPAVPTPHALYQASSTSVQLAADTTPVVDINDSAKLVSGDIQLIPVKNVGEAYDAAAGVSAPGSYTLITAYGKDAGTLGARQSEFAGLVGDVDIVYQRNVNDRNGYLARYGFKKATVGITDGNDDDYDTALSIRIEADGLVDAPTYFFAPIAQLNAFLGALMTTREDYENLDLTEDIIVTSNGQTTDYLVKRQRQPLVAFIALFSPSLATILEPVINDAVAAGYVRSQPGVTKLAPPLKETIERLFRVPEKLGEGWDNLMEQKRQPVAPLNVNDDVEEPQDEPSAPQNRMAAQVVSNDSNDDPAPSPAVLDEPIVNDDAAGSDDKKEPEVKEPEVTAPGNDSNIGNEPPVEPKVSDKLSWKQKRELKKAQKEAEKALDKVANNVTSGLDKVSGGSESNESKVDDKKTEDKKDGGDAGNDGTDSNDAGSKGNDE